MRFFLPLLYVIHSNFVIFLAEIRVVWIKGLNIFARIEFSRVEVPFGQLFHLVVELLVIRQLTQYVFFHLELRSCTLRNGYKLLGLFFIYLQGSLVKIDFTSC